MQKTFTKTLSNGLVDALAELTFPGQIVIRSRGYGSKNLTETKTLPCKREAQLTRALEQLEKEGFVEDSAD